MSTITKKAINVTVLAYFLLNLSACATSQSPTMENYSYVPPTNVLAPTPNPGIEDF